MVPNPDTGDYISENVFPSRRKLYEDGGGIPGIWFLYGREKKRLGLSHEQVKLSRISDKLAAHYRDKYQNEHDPMRLSRNYRRHYLSPDYPNIFRTKLLTDADRVTTKAFVGALLLSTAGPSRNNMLERIEECFPDVSGEIKILLMHLMLGDLYETWYVEGDINDLRKSKPLEDLTRRGNLNNKLTETIEYMDEFIGKRQLDISYRELLRHLPTTEDGRIKPGLTMPEVFYGYLRTPDLLPGE